MRNRIICLILAGVMSVSLVACSGKDSGSATKSGNEIAQAEETEETNEDTKKAEEKEDNNAGDKEAEGEWTGSVDGQSDKDKEETTYLKKYTSGRVWQPSEDGRGPEETEGDEGDNGFETEYTFCAVTEDTGIYTDATYYSNNMSTVSTYEGKYEMRDGFILFTYGKTGDGYRLYLDGDKITRTEFFYVDAGTPKLEGIYKGYDDNYGDMTLEASDNGSAKITCSNGKIMDGAVYSNEDDWEFIYSGNPEDPFIDWIIYVSGNRFTYETYRKHVYGRYAGQYVVEGDMGEISITVDEEGYGDAYVNVYGVMRHFKGIMYFNAYNDCKVTGGYLEDSEGYRLNIDIQQLTDGTLNYSGFLEMPLAAG